MIKNRLKRGASVVQSAGFMFAYLYRHALELAIKGFLASGNSVKAGLYRHPPGHDLVHLWNLARPYAENMLVSFDPLEQPTFRSKLDDIGRITQQIGEYDPQSDAFRYPATKNGQPNLPGLRYLDLNELSCGIKESIGVLGWMADCLQYHQQFEGD